MNEEEIRELLREMGEEPVPADSLCRVRVGVAERTRRRATVWWWFSAAVAAACAVLLAVWLREPATVPTPAAPVVAREPAVVPEKAVRGAVAARVSPPQPVRTRRQQRRPAPPVEPSIVIRIETPDPNVVILLIGD